MIQPTAARIACRSVLFLLIFALAFRADDLVWFLFVVGSGAAAAWAAWRDSAS